MRLHKYTHDLVVEIVNSFFKFGMNKPKFGINLVSQKNPSTFNPILRKISSKVLGFGNLPSELHWEKCPFLPPIWYRTLLQKI